MTKSHNSPIMALVMTKKKIILEWKKLNYHYIMNCVLSKKIIIADKKLIRNPNIICVMDKNNFKEA